MRLEYCLRCGTVRVIRLLDGDIWPCHVCDSEHFCDLNIEEHEK